MLKRDITYEDFNGNQVTETFYFNISKPELVEFDVQYEDGFAGFIKNVINAKNNRELIKIFKEVVLLSYGQKSEDGKRFIKSDKLREEFSQTNAYNTLFMELAVDDGAAATFLLGIMPKDMVGELEKQIEESKAVTPTTTDA